MSELRKAVVSASNLCKSGYQSNSREAYATIERLLAPFKAVPKIASAMKLCRAGTISPRFAYPHIEDLLNDVLRADDEAETK